MENTEKIYKASAEIYLGGPFHLDQELPEGHRKYFINTLLGYEVDAKGIVYDEEGDKVTGNAFKTLNMIIHYLKDMEFFRGYRDGKRTIRDQIKTALDI